MARQKELINEELCNKAMLEMERLSDAKLCLQLQAIISCGKQPINLVADVIGKNRTTLWRWIKRFDSSGLDGLRAKPKGHRSSKLGEEEKQIISNWLIEGKDSKGDRIHWTLDRLRIEIINELGITVGRTPLWLTIRELGFRQKVPRPTHAKAEHKRQIEFKKNC